MGRHRIARWGKRPARIVYTAVGCTVAVACLAVVASSARADFGPCPSGQVGVACETLTVPLDRSGQVAGAVHLAVMRRTAPQQPSKAPLVVLAGGPGQSATPLFQLLSAVLAPLLTDRDLVVFDLRGTGASDALSCPALDAARTDAESDLATEQCATSLGPARAFYTSRDDAADIDAVRESLGVPRISLYGVSYGTYTALTYARVHPDRVESLVLDSVTLPDGFDTLERPSYQAYRRVLRGLCAGDCHGITRDPVADLARVVARARKRPIRSHAYTASGRRTRVRIGEPAVRAAVAAADLDPSARADLPSSLAAAAHGDSAPLARLLFDELTGPASRFHSAASLPALDPVRFLATTCEEANLPWARTAALSERRADLSAALDAVPESVFAPFSRDVEAETGIARACLDWPEGNTSSPLIGGAPANVPALLLVGADDTRTPVADARATAALFPQAQLLVVPQTGHSVLGTDLTGCGRAALARFATGVPTFACPSGPRLFPPTPVPPRSFARVPVSRRMRSKRGRTVAAAVLTLNDVTHQAIGRTLFSAEIAGGGLRGGHFRADVQGQTLRMRLIRFSYVPGVLLSGTARLHAGPIRSATAAVHISGRAAAHGTLTFRAGRVSGRLGGHAVHLASAAAAAGGTPRFPSLERLLHFRRFAAITRTAG